jgi:hypothetical protein
VSPHASLMRLSHHPSVLVFGVSTQANGMCLNCTRAALVAQSPLAESIVNWGVVLEDSFSLIVNLTCPARLRPYEVSAQAHFVDLAGRRQRHARHAQYRIRNPPVRHTAP